MRVLGGHSRTSVCLHTAARQFVSSASWRACRFDPLVWTIRASPSSNVPDVCLDTVHV